MPDTQAAADLVQASALTNGTVATFFWGVIGSLVSWRFVPQLGVLQKITCLLSSGALSVLGTPLVKATFELKDESMLYGVAGFIGVFGLSITASIFDTIKNTKWGSIIESRLGKSPAGTTGE